MNILFLSYYFEPDLCAGSFRNSPLFRQMLDDIGENDFIHVITTKPNRYKSYQVDCLEKEISKNYRIDRIEVPKHASGMVDQAKSFRAYYKGVKALIKDNQYDLVYASSSRLFTAFLGRRCALKNHCPLYLDIRDIFVDTMKSIFQNKKFIQIPAIWVLNQIEKYTFKDAAHINLVSEGFKDYFKKYSKPEFSYFTNAIDDAFMHAYVPSETKEEPPYIITYAGNIGSGQGLDKIIPEAALLLGDDYVFHIIGDGGARSRLEDKLKELNVKNVELFKPMPRKNLINEYNRSTFLFLHLNDLPAFKKVLPSKMFEYGAFDKPIIAGVGGYAAQFIQKNIPNTLLFAPTNVQDLVAKLKAYHLQFEVRERFVKDFSRANINQQMSKSILSYLKNLTNN